MEFEWDEAKNRQNIKKHGYDFADAHKIFEGLFSFKADLREDYGEDRWIGIGTIEGRLTAIVFTWPREKAIRVISLRKASKTERKVYEKAIKNRLV